MDPASQLQRHRKLIGVAHDLSRAENVEQLLDQILECSREVMDCEICSILLPEETSGDLLIRSTFDNPGDGPIRIPKGKGIASEVFEKKEVINIADAAQDPRHFSAASQEAGLTFRGILTVPLLDGDRALGVLQGINPQSREAFEDHDISVFETFASLISVTLIRLEANRTAIQQAQQNQQLELAREIQQSFLPPGETSIGSIRVEAFCQSASEVGGDFYFWHPLANEGVLLGLADVSGKGFAAALDMARCSTLIASMAHLADETSLGEWVIRLNARLCDVMAAGRFVAVTFLRINPQGRMVELCVCGCLPPRVLCQRTWEEVSESAHPPLGVTSSLTYQSEQIPLGLGSHWLLMTDGILETKNPRGEHFEDQALEASLKEIAESAAPQVLSSFRKAWSDFSKGATYQDDTTVLVFEDTRERPPAAFFFNCRPQILSEARNFVEQWTEFAALEEKAAGLVVLGCDEVFTNICKHAYSESGPAQCLASLTREGLQLLIMHQGEGIGNEALPDGEMPEAESIGGRGLFLIQEVFDRVDFATDESGSRITLIKHLSA